MRILLILTSIYLMYAINLMRHAAGISEIAPDFLSIQAILGTIAAMAFVSIVTPTNPKDE